MRLAIDIDGTICSFRKEGQTYADVEPLPGAVEKLQQFRKNGHYIILLTARHMKTTGANVGLVIARQGKTLLDWLERHAIPYDEVWFGKPQADVYIDDNGYRFTSWDAIDADGGNLPANKEKAEQAKSHTFARDMNVVVPMAGLGSRFREAGFDRPKPLIPVLGKPMYTWAVDSLPLSRAQRLIFILLRSQPEFEELRTDVLFRYKAHNPEVLDVPQLTAGQSETVMRAESLIDNSTPLLIHNADTAFEIDHVWVDQTKQLDGALLVFRSDEKRWSYSRTDESGRVQEVREKVPISPWASTGTYWFARGSDFVRLARRQATDQAREKGELYVGPLYNQLIEAGARVRNFEIDRLLCFGTPQDLDDSLKQIAEQPLRGNLA